METKDIFGNEAKTEVKTAKSADVKKTTTSQEGVEPEGTITELKSVYDKVISGISAIQTDDKKIQQLIAITSDYEVTDKFDEQMNELYHMGYNDKNI